MSRICFLIGTWIAIKTTSRTNNLQGSRIGHPLLDTFLDVIPDIANLVTDEFKRTFPTVV